MTVDTYTMADALIGLAQEQHDLADALRGSTDENDQEIYALLTLRADALDQVIEETGLDRVEEADHV